MGKISRLMEHGSIFKQNLNQQLKKDKT
ncbi:hypothetical protein GHI35_08810 [Neisseria meningitidis]|jgi:hypothetical protein|nr:hypothetical protein A6J53_15055 [Neisseria meningitidis]AVI44767.1 hypothetical protein A6J51_13765 [Neisseria meningitidis]MBG8577719.1 hypothetical protein [Neisseria meningitidis]MBG8581265.1 hypothetical protein [Neisseria meningitidis]MBG8590194.1 hypothetical protein [Neisseria meningitidis]